MRGMAGWVVPCCMCPLLSCAEQTGVVRVVLPTPECPAHREPAVGVGLPAADAYCGQSLPRALLLVGLSHPAAPADAAPVSKLAGA